MKTIRSALLSCAFLTGCTHFDGYPDRPDGFVEASAHLAEAFSDAELARYKLLSNQLLTLSDAQQIALIHAQMGLVRNEIVNKQIQAYDFEFTAFISDLTGLNVITNTGVEWTSLALAGLTATVGGETTKAALGAANTGVIGAKSSFQKEVLAEKTIPVLITAMISERTKALLVIRQGLAKPVTDYNLYQALSDLEKYYAAGSINGALIQIAENAGTETKEAEDEILAITAAADDNTALLRAFWLSNGVINAANQTELQNWMTANGLAVRRGAISYFLRANEFKELRAKAVQDLGLPR